MKLMINIPWAYYNYTKKYHDLSYIETKVLIEALIKGVLLEEDGDCISRQAVIDACNAFADEVNQDTDIHEAIEIVLNLPPVTPQTKTGRWILRDDINGQYQCEECGMFTGLDRFDVKEGGFELPKYCSNCGAKMIEPQESGDNE